MEHTGLVFRQHKTRKIVERMPHGETHGPSVSRSHNRKTEPTLLRSTLGDNLSLSLAQSDNTF